MHRTEIELVSHKINIFANDAIFMSQKAINRIKMVLVEKNLRSSEWLIEQFGKNEAKISRWCATYFENIGFDS